MKTDFFTKSVLTIIAICLLYFAGKDIVAPAYADRKEIIDQLFLASPLPIVNDLTFTL